jgi:predicted permease
MYTPAAGTRTNSLAVVSLVTGIASFIAHIPIPGFGGFTVALVAVITGYMARNQIRQTGEQGMGMATAGMVIGIVHLALLGLLVIVLLVLIFSLGIALFRH